MIRRTRITLAAASGLLFFLAAGFASAPLANAEAPGWMIASASSPTNFTAGDESGDDQFVVTVVDNQIGTTASTNPIEVTDTLPSGLTARSISGEDLGDGRALTCSVTPRLGCSYDSFEIASGDVLQIRIAVNVATGVAPSVVNSATVTGGGAATGASTHDPTTIGSAPAGFGISQFAVGWSTTQAGASVNLTTALTLDQLSTAGNVRPAADPRQVTLRLPPGFIVDPRAVPVCSSILASEARCPADSAVGVAFTSTASDEVDAAPYSSLVYNAVPSPGELGALVLLLPGGPVRLDVTLGAGGDYDVRLALDNLPQVDPLVAMALTLWGDPTAYDAPGPDRVIGGGAPSFGAPSGPPVRFLTSAGTCDGASPASGLSADAWAAPEVFDEASAPTAPLTGCNRLPFDPSLSVSADASEADAPSGYHIGLSIPQPEDPEGLASAELKEALVTLPEGAGLSLSSADGLLACTEAQAGFDATTPTTCPDAAKVGRAVIRTPLEEDALEGGIYLATPESNPFGSPLAVYIIAESPVSGTRVKLAGQLDPNPLTGQLTLVLRELPQTPISALEMDFFGGERALLSTPSTCGPAASTGELTPWSGDAGATAFSAFNVELELNGAPCTGAQAFAPTFRSGIGATGETDVYRSLTVLVTRTDREEELGAIAIQAPQPVAQIFAGAATCEEPQAAQGTCPAASHVGVVAAQAGLLYTPADLDGDVYLTGPYEGAPQGLAIVLPVDPGPFELGPLVVRAGMRIDPAAKRLEVASDRLPTFADGVPLKLKALELQLERGEFRIAPDGCEPLTVTGAVSSVGGSNVTATTEPLGASSSSCPAPASNVTPAATPPAPSARAGLSLLGARIAVEGGGRLTIRLRCTGAARCHGKLALTVSALSGKGGKRRLGTLTIGVGAFSIASGATAAVLVRLDAAGRASLSAHHGRLDASLTIVEMSTAPSETRTVTVQLARPRPHRGAER